MERVVDVLLRSKRPMSTIPKPLWERLAPRGSKEKKQCPNDLHSESDKGPNPKSPGKYQGSCFLTTEWARKQRHASRPLFRSVSLPTVLQDGVPASGICSIRFFFNSAQDTFAFSSPRMAISLRRVAFLSFR